FLTMQEFRSYQRSAVTAIRYCYDNKLLLEFYFHRLDADGDDRLSRDELPFQGRPPGAMKLLAADGSALLPLYTNAEYPHCGSPAVSPDGQTIAFDGRR